MEKTNIYSDIAKRTDGDIYIGIVGPVRTGKSTFIKKFMETLVIPNIESEYRKERAIDELPQSAAGKTIMTTEPKFIPEEAVKIVLEGNAELNVKLKECLEKKEQMSAEYKGFFAKQEEVSKHQAELDKEIFRLNNQKEKLREADEYQTNYMWEEYELTPHAAAELRNDAYDDLGALKKLIAQIKDDIRRLGDVKCQFHRGIQRSIKTI